MVVCPSFAANEAVQIGLFDEVPAMYFLRRESAPIFERHILPVLCEVVALNPVSDCALRPAGVLGGFFRVQIFGSHDLRFLR